MTISVLAISFDAHNAAELAQFWAKALHRTVSDGATEDFASIDADADHELGPYLMFHKCPRAKRSRTASTSTSKPPMFWLRSSG
jgi:hypothetical protein